MENISNYLYITLKDNLKSLKYFSIDIDETNDIKDVPQVSFFLKGITNEFKMIHESLGLVPLEETTKGRDLFVSLKNIIEKYDLSWKIFRLTTDGDRNMTGKFNGVQGFINQNLEENEKVHKMHFFHCVVHQEVYERTL